jgi:aminoglycoside phosphotransferase (APT) family kinase protein
MTKVPTSASSISADWLNDILHTQGTLDDAVTVDAVTAEALPAGVGFMGEVTRLRVEYVGGSGPATMMAKIPTQDTHVRSLLAPARVFEREARFYEQLAPRLDVVPNAYGVACDHEAGDYLLLLEDLGHLRGGDQAAGLSVADARAALLALARLHARFWQSPDLDRLDWMPPINDAGMKISREVYNASLPGFRDVFAHALEAEHEDLIARFGDATPDLLDRFAAMPNTVVHFDYRADNLFFGDEGDVEAVRIIDFQASSKGGGAYDVGYFVSQNLATDLRRQHETSLLRAYHDELMAHGVSGYAWEQFCEDYRVGVLYGWIIPVYAVGTLDSSSERAIALWTAVIQRAQAAMSDHNVAELLA